SSPTEQAARRRFRSAVCASASPEIFIGRDNSHLGHASREQAARRRTVQYADHGVEPPTAHEPPPQARTAERGCESLSASPLVLKQGPSGIGALLQNAV